MQEFQTQIQQGQQEIDDGWAEYREGLAQYEDGLAQYEEGLREFEAQRPQAEQELRDVYKRQHVIQMVGKNPGITVTALASRMNKTPSALSLIHI